LRKGENETTAGYRFIFKKDNGIPKRKKDQEEAQKTGGEKTIILAEKTKNRSTSKRHRTQKLEKKKKR